MRLGILGGSFDPPHNAHLIFARLALEELHLDAVALMVAAIQPLKLEGHRATAADRLRMVELTVAGEAGLHADGRELTRPGPSYTIDTLRELHAEDPGRKLFLLMGADVARGLPRWKDPVGIRELAGVIVGQRAGEVAPSGFDGVVPMPSIDISSSAVRARARAGLSLGGWVHCRVAEYIAASNIYRSDVG